MDMLIPHCLLGTAMVVLGILWLFFLLFHVSPEVWEDVPVDGRVGVRTVK